MTHWLLMLTPDADRIVALDLGIYRDMARQIPHVNCRCVGPDAWNIEGWSG